MLLSHFYKKTNDFYFSSLVLTTEYKNLISCTPNIFYIIDTYYYTDF